MIIELIVPRQQMGAERLQDYVQNRKLYVKGGSGTKEVILGRSNLIKLITLGNVSVNNQITKDKYVKIRANDIITIKLIVEDEQDNNNNKNENDVVEEDEEFKMDSLIKLVPTNIPIDVMYEDEHIVVVNKPAGMLVHPAPVPSHLINSSQLNEDNQTKTLVNALLFKYGVDGLSSQGGCDRPGIVHRLDKDTAGILVVAKTDLAHTEIKKLFEDHTNISTNTNTSKKNNNNKSSTTTTIQKTYICLVSGKPKENHGFINKSIARHPMDKNKMVIDEVKGKQSLTEYKVIKSWDKIDLHTIKLKKKSTNNNNNKISKSRSKSTSDEYDIVIKKKSSKKQQPQSNSKSKFLSFDSDDEEDEEDDEEEDEDEQDSEDEDEQSEEEEEESSEEEEKEFIKGKKIGSQSYSLLEVTLHTGRTHQIRVHMASQGTPIVGDPIYSGKTNQHMVPYLLLASINLIIKHPFTEDPNPMTFNIPYPPHIQSFMDQLDKESTLNNNNNSNNNTSKDNNNKAIPKQNNNNNSKSKLNSNSSTSATTKQNNNNKQQKGGKQSKLSLEEEMELMFLKDIKKIN